MNNPKINYVIATYQGIGKRRYTYPLPKDTIRHHLKKIISLKNNLSQITIMKTTYDGPENKKCKGYYDLNDIISNSNIKIEIIECKNYGMSSGQFLKAYEIYKEKFDYYIFMEDDYCWNFNNFDKIIIESYNMLFKDNTGILASLIRGDINYKKTNSHPIHYNGSFTTSSKSLNKLYNDKRWNQGPLKCLSMFNEKDSKSFKKVSWGYYQLAISHLFTLSGMKHKDYLDLYYSFKQDKISLKKNDKYYNLFKFIYWCDNEKKKGGELWYFDSKNRKEKRRKVNSLNDIKYSLVIPVQISDTKGINYYFE